MAVRTIDSYFRIPGPPWVRFTAYFVYYLAILIGLMLIYGKGDFTTTPFIYQGF